ncbi:hypothetical protein [Photobacterium nomapromontoriensis]|uniref:hypothetical protein n=1 Tax=Photobacterium nomapromontoriensis TaxID=2910237 RepID=UPI003D10DD2C
MVFSDFNRLALSHLNRLLMYFASSTILFLLSLRIRDWAGSFIGWQSTFMTELFYIPVVVFGFCSLFMLALIASWFASYQEAKCEAENFNLEMIKRRWSRVIGPIRWK